MLRTTTSGNAGCLLGVGWVWAHSRFLGWLAYCIVGSEQWARNAGHTRYRLLFSHQTLVADLLRGFLPPDWVAVLDLASLERLSASFVSEQLDQREGDVIWRVRWGPNWLYVLILLEFQSSDDPHMAVRIAAYGALLYQELIRNGAVTHDAKLPPLLPIVLYNGTRRWTGATMLVALMETPPAGLAAYQLQVQYLLIDEQRLSDVTLDKLSRNVAATLTWGKNPGR